MYYSFLLILLFHTWAYGCFCFRKKSTSPISLTIIHENVQPNYLFKPISSLEALQQEEAKHKRNKKKSVQNAHSLLNHPTARLPMQQTPITVDQITHDLQQGHYTFLIAAVWAHNVPDLNQQDRSGRLALVIAARRDDKVLTNFLTKLGARWNCRDGQGNSAQTVRKQKYKKGRSFTDFQKKFNVNPESPPILSKENH